MRRRLMYKININLKDGDYYLNRSFDIDGDSTAFEKVIFNISNDEICIYRSEVKYYPNDEYPYNCYISSIKFFEEFKANTQSTDEYYTEQEVLEIADKVCQKLTEIVNEICGTNYKSAGAKYPLYDGSYEDLIKIE